MRIPLPKLHFRFGSIIGLLLAVVLIQCQPKPPDPDLVEVDRAKTIFAGTATDFRAFDAKTLTILWHNQEVKYVTATPTYANGTVYTASMYPSSGQLFALDANTGIIKWKVDSVYTIRSSPTVAHGMVYVETDYGALLAFDAQTGAPKWRFETGRITNSHSPTVAKGVIYSCIGQKLYALDALTGQKKWEIDGIGTTNPSVVDGIVYVGIFGGPDLGMCAFDALTGQKKWQFRTPFGVKTCPTVINGIAYLAADHLYAFNAQTGEKIWDFYPGEGYGFVSSPFCVNRVIYVGSWNNYFYAFDAKTGVKLWDSDFGGAIDKSPVVVDNTLYIGGSRSGIYSFDAQTGTYQLGSDPPSQPGQPSYGLCVLTQKGKVIHSSDNGNQP